ncbi:MAG: porin [Myxococcota bacterium]
MKLPSLVSLSVLAVGSQAAAQEAASKWPANLQAAGFVDAYYMVNLNQPGTDMALFRAFDRRDREFALNLAELAIGSAPEPVGFRIDLDFGPTTEAAHMVEPGGPEVMKHIQQAYGSAKFDVGRGLTLDVGKFVTHMGQEVIETRDNWNYSRSLLFTWAIPFYHFGARLSTPLSDTLTGALMVVNGWNNVADTNERPSLGLQLAATPSSSLTAYLNYVGGPEQPGNDDDLRHVIDVVAIITASDKLTLGVNGDYGMEKVGDATMKWFGVAGTGRLAFTDTWAAALRAEWFKDADGFMTATGVEQSLIEATATLEAKYGGGLIARLEFRHDHASEDVFPTDDTPENMQNTVTLGTVIGF